MRRLEDHHRSPVFCVFLSDPILVENLPASDVGLAMHWWWGIISALEVRLLCRLLNGKADDAATLWREHLLPSLTGGDVVLADFLWDSLQGTEDDLYGRLVSFAEGRDWTSERLRPFWAGQAFEARAPINGGGRLAVPEYTRSLWALGAVQVTPEYGMELSSAALAQLGRRETVRHRVWRGEAGLLLPLLDGVRLRLCARLTRLFGSDWPLRWRRPESLEEMSAVAKDPFACQLGHLGRNPAILPSSILGTPVASPSGGLPMGPE